MEITSRLTALDIRIFQVKEIINNKIEKFKKILFSDAELLYVLEELYNDDENLFASMSVVFYIILNGEKEINVFNT